MRAPSAVAAALALLASAAQAPAAGPTCVPSFPYQQGWYGADSAASIPLSAPDQTPARTLWLFGDTFVSPTGSEQMPNRLGTAFLNNTVAHGTCDENGVWSIDYQWDESGSGPLAVFRFEDDPTGKIFYWPLAGVEHDGAAYVLLIAVRANNKNTAFARIDARLRDRFGHLGLRAFAAVQRRAYDRAAHRLGGDRIVGVAPALAEEDDPFTILGTAIARIANPGDPARDWQIDYREVSRNRSYFPAGAAVIDDGFLYLLGWKQSTGAGVGMQFLARIPLAVVSAFPEDIGEHVEVFGENGWGGPTTPPRILMEGAFATEMGVQRLPDDCGWLVSQKGAFAPVTGEAEERIFIRTARALEGPWSSERLLGKTVELSPDAATGTSPNAICYAAKVHPWLSPADRLLYTYICNVFLSPIPFELWRRMDLYVPRAVSVSLPTPGNAEDIAPECPWLIPD